jgi:GGDEF domain-containing protein
LALDSTDPMTGFSDAKGFQNDLLQAWHDAKLTQTEVSVAYVALLETVRNERTMRRIVRILRTVAQEGDSVARLDDGTMALLLVNQGVGEGLSDRLSRIVALGLMPDNSDKAAPILRFRIGATSSTHYTSDISGLGADLRRFMADDERWQGKTIRFLTMRRPHERPSFESSDSFEQFWDQAVDAAAAAQAKK